MEWDGKSAENIFQPEFKRREEVIPDNFLSKTNTGLTRDDGSDGWLLSSSVPDEEEEVEALNTACLHTAHTLDRYTTQYPGARDLNYPTDELSKGLDYYGYYLFIRYYFNMRNPVTNWHTIIELVTITSNNIRI